MCAPRSKERCYDRRPRPASAAFKGYTQPIKDVVAARAAALAEQASDSKDAA